MCNEETGIISIQGRIDSQNASEFTEHLLAYKDRQSVVIDAANLEYISSAGLRGLLALKKAVKDVTVINVSPMVYDIFEMTGFADILTVRKILKEVSIADCPIIGYGSTGIVYKLDDERIIKVYNDSYSYEMALSEYTASKKAFVVGVPTVIPFEIVKVGNAFAVEYELYDSITLGKAFMDYPEKFDELIDLYVDLIKTLPDIEVTDGSFVSIKQTLNAYADRMANFLKAEDISLLREIIEYTPEVNKFVHGDLHPGNIMYKEGELMLIDLAGASVGPESYDLFCLYRDMLFPLQNEEHIPLVEKSLGMSAAVIKKVWEALLGRLFIGLSEEEKQKKVETMALGIMPNIILMAAGQPDEHIRAILPGWQQIIDNIIRPNKDLIIQIVSEM